MRETYSTIRHLLHLATELDRACALFLSTHVSITHDEARVLLELGAAQQSLRPGALAKQLNLQPSTLSRVLRIAASSNGTAPPRMRAAYH